MIELKQLVLDDAKSMNKVLIVGRRATGKTSLAKHLLTIMNPANVTIFNPKSQEYPNSSSLREYDEYTEDRVHVAIQTQKSVVRHYHKQGKCLECPQACIVFDNCMYNTDWNKHRSMMELFMNGRFLHTHVIMTTSMTFGMLPMIRCNLDYVFLFKEHQMNARRRIYEQFAGMFETFEEFCQTFDRYTAEPYSCIVINNTAKSNKLEDNVMYHK